MARRSSKRKAGRRKNAARTTAVKTQLSIHAALRTLTLAAEDITVNNVRLRTPASRLLSRRGPGVLHDWNDKDKGPGSDKHWQWDDNKVDGIRTLPDKFR